MNIAREYEVERVVSKDTSRTYLCHCYLDVEKQRLVATDGHAMAVEPEYDLWRGQEVGTPAGQGALLGPRHSLRSTLTEATQKSFN